MCLPSPTFEFFSWKFFLTTLETWSNVPWKISNKLITKYSHEKSLKQVFFQNLLCWDHICNFAKGSSSMIFHGKSFKSIYLNFLSVYVLWVNQLPQVSWLKEKMINVSFALLYVRMCLDSVLALHRSVF